MSNALQICANSKYIFETSRIPEPAPTPPTDQFPCSLKNLWPLPQPIPDSSESPCPLKNPWVTNPSPTKTRQLNPHEYIYSAKQCDRVLVLRRLTWALCCRHCMMQYCYIWIGICIMAFGNTMVRPASMRRRPFESASDACCPRNRPGCDCISYRFVLDS